MTQGVSVMDWVRFCWQIFISHRNEWELVRAGCLEPQTKHKLISQTQQHGCQNGYLWCKLCVICRKWAEMKETPRYGPLRPWYVLTRSRVPVRQSLQTPEPDSQNILLPLGLGDNTERLRAGPTFYDTPPGTVPKIRLPLCLLCVWTRFSLWNFRL